MSKIALILPCFVNLRCPRNPRFLSSSFNAAGNRRSFCDYSPPQDGFAEANLIHPRSRINRVRVMSRTSASSSSELLRAHCAAIANEESVLREGGGKAGHERQRKMNRLPVRERLGRLLDKESPFFEIGLWAAYKMYEQWGKIPAAGVVAGIGDVEDVPCMIIANDATVKAGSFFPQTTKKVIRAQRIAFECSLPIIYLVDSAGGCRMRFFQTRTISVASFAITPLFQRLGFPSSQRSWVIAWLAGPIFLYFATKF